MLVCFGATWPFSIYKVWKKKTSAGKSVIFLWLVFIGYAAGIAHKILYSRDWVMALYVFNGALVMTDLLLSYHYARPRPAGDDGKLSQS